MTQKPLEHGHLPPSHPFDETICDLAERLKSAGLTWTPRVGDFVWDKTAVINYPSPFPNRIYFILNINRFLEIYHTADQMIEKLIWLPVWHQARVICADLNIDDKMLMERFCEQGGFETEKDLSTIYKIILSSLKNN
jgi:hypothetical protein